MNMLATKVVSKTIDTIARNMTRIDSAVHDCAIQCLLHARRQDEGGHGDVRLIQRLVQALGKSGRKEALKFWVMQFSPIRFDKDGTASLLAVDTKGYTPFKIEQATKVAFFDLTKERVDFTMNAAYINRTIRSMQQRLAKAVAGEDGYKVEGDADALSAYLTSIASIPMPKELAPKPVTETTLIKGESMEGKAIAKALRKRTKSAPETAPVETVPVTQAAA